MTGSRPTQIQSAELGFDEGGRPFSRRYQDVYRSRAGAFEEAAAVFLDGCGLRQRWRARPRFCIVELGFGLGVNFLATLAAWAEDAERPASLDFVSVEAHPLSRADLARALDAVGARGRPVESLLAQWPLPLPGLHRLVFAEGRVRLTLAIGEAASMVTRLPAAADAFFLDGFAPARNPGMWAPGLFRQLARLARPDAGLATYTAARGVREALSEAGFEVALAPGFGGKRERIVGRYAPRWRSFPPPPEAPAWSAREAIVIGAGLSGCAVTAALAARGWQVSLLEDAAAIARGGSAQPLVADHLHVAPDDNPLARLTRAALLLGRSDFPSEHPAGKLQAADTEAEALRQADTVRRLGFPADFVQALDVAQASDQAGLRLARGGLWLPLAGLADPAARCRSLLERAGDRVRLRLGTRVHALRYRDGRWEALGDAGRCLAVAPVVVLANAGDAQRLGAQQAAPLRRVRGQTTRVAAGALPRLQTVLGGDAYACPTPDGGILVGSTFDDGESLVPDPEADLSNLRRLLRILAPGSSSLDVLLASAAPGACGFRYTTHDRLPVIGALPDEAEIRRNAPAFARNDRLELPAMPGLYGAYGYGSRGLLWSGLGAGILAAAIEGTPAPVETDLLAAVSPARFLRQQLRRRRLR